MKRTCTSRSNRFGEGRDGTCCPGDRDWVPGDAQNLPFAACEKRPTGRSCYRMFPVDLIHAIVKLDNDTDAQFPTHFRDVKLGVWDSEMVFFSYCWGFKDVCSEVNTPYHMFGSVNRSMPQREMLGPARTIWSYLTICRFPYVSIAMVVPK